MTTARLHVTERTGRLHVRWWADDAQLWRAILVDFKSAFRVHSECIYCTTTKSWSLPLRCRRRLMEWSDCWFNLDEQHWDDEEPEPAPRGGPPPGGQVPQSLAEAHATLFLREGAPLWAAEAVYRAGMKRAHPDVGGNHQSAVSLTQAIERIRTANGKRRSA